MKNPVKPVILPLFTIIAGVIGMLLRLWLFATGVDERGLLVTSHPANYAIYIVFFAVLAVVLLSALNCPKTMDKPFPASIWASFGCFAAAAGILMADFVELDLQSLVSLFTGGSRFAAANIGQAFSLLSFLAGLMAAGCFLWFGICRIRGQQAPLAAHVLITAYFMIHLVLQYRQWSAEPQLQNYLFPLLASIFLMLNCYHRSVLELKHTNRRWFVFTNQCALFCSFLSMNTESWIFYVAMILWNATDLHIHPKREAK